MCNAGEVTVAAAASRKARLRAGVRAGIPFGVAGASSPPGRSLAHGHHVQVGAQTAGVAAGGLVAWRVGSIVACVVVAAGVTAGLRAL